MGELFEKVESHREERSGSETFCTFKSLPSSSNNTNTCNVPFAVRNVHLPFSAIKRYACMRVKTTRAVMLDFIKQNQKHSFPFCFPETCFCLSLFPSVIMTSRWQEQRRHNCNIYSEICLRAHKAH